MICLSPPSSIKLTIKQGEGEEGEDEVEEDDLEVALAILEVAAVAFTKKLHEAEKVDEEGKPISETQMRDHYKQRLADTYELLAEIHLEDQRSILTPLTPRNPDLTSPHQVSSSNC